jgi:hypothetical protein
LTEPDTWPLRIDAPADHPASGSLLFIAHEVDASFGTVTVEPGP